MSRKRKASRQKQDTPARGKEPSFWKITTFVSVIFLVGLVVKTVYSPSPSPKLSPATLIQPATVIQPATSPAANSVGSQVDLVARNFKCACGGCGELPLVECECSMPRGALEEKSFIRGKLREGLSVPEVIDLVDQQYGLRIT